MTVIIVLLISAFAPFILLPIEQLFAWPHIFEELFKLLIAIVLVNNEKQERKSALIWMILAAVIFSFSESVLYLMNFFLLGNLQNLPIRLTLTSSLHIITSVIIFLSLRRSKLISALALLLAMLIHFFFNTQVASIF